MMIKVRRYDWRASFTFRPPLVEAILNTDQISSAVKKSDGDRIGPHTEVTMIGGGVFQIEGEPDQLLKEK